MAHTGLQEDMSFQHLCRLSGVWNKGLTLFALYRLNNPKKAFFRMTERRVIQTAKDAIDLHLWQFVFSLL